MMMMIGDRNNNSDNNKSDNDENDDNGNNKLPVDSPHKGPIMLTFDVCHLCWV